MAKWDAFLQTNDLWKGRKTMRQVVKEGFKEEKDNRVAVWRLEVDYELATLYEAMQKENEEQVEQSKNKLERLRKEWIRLNG
ncbi:YkzI [Bacillus vallismortis]